MGLGNMVQARDELKQILEANPNSQEAMIQMGVVLVNEKKFKEAEDTFRKSYDLNPANSRGLMGLAEKMTGRALIALMRWTMVSMLAMNLSVGVLP